MKSDVRRWRPGRLVLGMVLGLLVLLFGGLSYAQSARETPEYALGRIAQAIEGRDGAELACYVAVDELLLGIDKCRSKLGAADINRQRAHTASSTIASRYHWQICSRRVIAEPTVTDQAPCRMACAASAGEL